jgi:3'-phosphoadenosine 5'-phosphosulfate sulfotransferase (PAPS reductase)/FAD synthetase
MYSDATLENRILCWFSCGATSAVATKLIIQSQQQHPVEIVYTQVKEEHKDNARFLKDCEGWFGQDITIIRNEKYAASIYEVFERERYLVGPYGAPCTKHLKRNMREKFQRQGDVHILGFSVEETARAEQFEERNPSLVCRFPLIEQRLAKADCLAILDRSGIELPVMYSMGYEHNNCIGCVKGKKGYWNKIRTDFPDTFKKMSKLERNLGVSILREKGEKLFLDQLDPTAGRGQKETSIECGVFANKY